MRDLKALYEQDFAARTRHQAEAFARGCAGGSNQPLDWEHLAEEQVLGDWFPEEPPR